MEIARKSYPSDVSDDEWALIAPYLTLLPEDAGQREYPLREAFNGLRYIIKTGAQWRAMPHDLPPWAAVYQQARRWLAWGVVQIRVTPKSRNPFTIRALSISGVTRKWHFLNHAKSRHSRQSAVSPSISSRSACGF